MEKMKIIYFTRIYYPHEGGLQKYIYNLIENIMKYGVDVEIITGDTNIKNVKNEYINNILVHRIPTINVFGLVLLRKYKYTKIIKDYMKDADIIHVNEIKFLPIFFYFMQMIQKNQKKKYFLSSHGFIFHTNKFIVFKKLYMHFFSYLSIKYDGIFCVSKQDFRIAQEYGFKNYIYIPVGVDISKFKNIHNNIEKGKLFYYGRISKNKGIENALVKFASLPKEFLFVIAGTGDPVYMKEIIFLVDKLGIHDRISFIEKPTDDDLIVAMGTSEFIILPSLYEGFGITLIESLAAKKKVIAHVNESYRDILSDLSLDNYLFDFTDDNSLLIEKIILLRTLRMGNVDLNKYLIDTVTADIYGYYKMTLN
jgi:glycosyltransferase involved in cell wall biosynthesis